MLCVCFGEDGIMTCAVVLCSLCVTNGAGFCVAVWFSVSVVFRLLRCRLWRWVAAYLRWRCIVPATSVRAASWIPSALLHHVTETYFTSTHGTLIYMLCYVCVYTCLSRICHGTISQLVNCHSFYVNSCSNFLLFVFVSSRQCSFDLLDIQLCHDPGQFL